MRLALRGAWALLNRRSTAPTISKGDAMGQVIMLGTLFGLVALVVALVLRFDPEARGPRDDGEQP